MHMSLTNSATETNARATLKRKQRSFELHNNDNDGGFPSYARSSGMFLLYLDVLNEA